MVTENQKELVLDEIRRHYEEQALPYYLANLGQFFQSNEIVLPPGTRFKAFLSDNFEDRLVVVQDPTVPARIAIALPGNREQIQQQLSGQIMSSPGRPPIEINRLPFSLIAAFCQRPAPGNRVYFRTIRPCRYVIAPVAPDSSFVEIGEQLRQSPPIGASVHTLSNEAKQEIYRRIAKWVESEGIDLEAIYVYERGSSHTSSNTRKQQVANALQRLLEAQDPELRRKIQVPGDIALTLMRME